MKQRLRGRNRPVFPSPLRRFPGKCLRHKSFADKWGHGNKLETRQFQHGFRKPLIWASSYCHLPMGEWEGTRVQGNFGSPLWKRAVSLSAWLPAWRAEPSTGQKWSSTVYTNKKAISVSLSHCPVRGAFLLHPAFSVLRHPFPEWGERLCSGQNSRKHNLCKKQANKKKKPQHQPLIM